MKIEIIKDHCGQVYLARLELLRILGWTLKLHIFAQGDEDRELHDHPWGFFTWIIVGQYFEQTDEAGGGVLRKRWSLRYRPARWRHRVQLLRNARGELQYVATVVVTRPPEREWGFWKNGVFVKWFHYRPEREC